MNWNRMAKVGAFAIAFYGSWQPALAQQTEAGESGCASLVAERAEHVRKESFEGLWRSAARFVDTCRPWYPKAEIGRAMAEQVWASRRLGQRQAAMGLAHECLKTQYQNLACHLERAEMMMDVGFMAEARQILVTVSGLIKKVEDTCEGLRGRIAAGEGRLSSAELKTMRMELEIYRAELERAKHRLATSRIKV